MKANDRQVNGEHYKSKIQHWDYVVANDLDYFQAQITKYVTRWKKKNGLVDLEKGLHFLEKYIELEKERLASVAREYPVPTLEESLDKIGSYVGVKYDADYQERLSEKMAKMRLDAMTGIPDHLREIAAEDSAISPMLQKYWGSTSEEPLPHGYVNQDGENV